MYISPQFTLRSSRYCLLQSVAWIRWRQRAWLVSFHLCLCAFLVGNDLRRCRVNIYTGNLVLFLWRRVWWTLLFLLPPGANPAAAYTHKKHPLGCRSSFSVVIYKVRADCARRIDDKTKIKTLTMLALVQHFRWHQFVIIIHFSLLQRSSFTSIVTVLKVFVRFTSGRNHSPPACWLVLVFDFTIKNKALTYLLCLKNIPWFVKLLAQYCFIRCL